LIVGPSEVINGTTKLNVGTLQTNINELKIPQELASRVC